MRMVGAMLAKGAFDTLKQRMDPDGYGGAPLLGLNGNVIKAHGSAREAAIMNAVRVATETIKQQVNQTIMQQVSKSKDLFGASAA
jgi:glycerol-3-phosphate acyltransferase PlsX